MIDKIWYIHCKSEEIYQFVVRNCQGFDQHTDFIEEAHVCVLDSDGGEKVIDRNLIRINKQMVDVIQKYKNRFGNTSFG